MRRLVRKLHTYAGLLSFAAFIVYGISGLYATFRLSADGTQPAVLTTRDVPFEAPGGLTDRELADRVHDLLGLSLTSRPLNRFVTRDANLDLVLEYPTPNGSHRVTVQEQQQRVRIETRRVSLASFLNQLHMARGSPDSLLLRTWTWYNWIAMFSLLVMAVSGVYLWLATRPGHIAARASLAAGGLVFLSLAVLLW